VDDLGYFGDRRVTCRRSGLGLEAQRKSVEDFLNGGRWTVLAEFVEVESGSRDGRPKLAEALGLCRLHGATLGLGGLT